MSFSTCVSLANGNDSLIYPWPWKDGSRRACRLQDNAYRSEPGDPANH
ncbi:hypothetical protein GA0061070_104045 [Kosakonia oryziphila]|uniref:Uncharacterized protein n=1 Tax=Kosakonia oryziphila TaxID=1005667 RepID=A0A1C4FR37_9ENTR|nr:hypothetical protein GA0061070_104045 [Kosakonia oryziphila]